MRGHAHDKGGGAGPGAALRRRGRASSLGLLATMALAAAGPAAAAEPQPPATMAQRLYETTRGRLLQVRTLLRGQDSQASVGSAFVVSADGHAVTNYHVVSQAALMPKRYRLAYTGADGEEGGLELLAFDVIHDLAVVKLVRPAGAAPRSALAFRPLAAALVKGERLYSLGNPLDVGFSVNAGTYNGPVERAFHPSLFFGGALNPGMSGGPALDELGRVAGVNVATRVDGQQVGFLVPAAFAQQLLARATAAPERAGPAGPVYAELTRQLIAHQEELTTRFLAQPWRSSRSARYTIPVPQETFMRCWGQGSSTETRSMQFERSECAMDRAVYVSGSLQTGTIRVRHEEYDGSKLGTLRFAKQYSASFRNEGFGGGGRERTPPQCHQRDVERGGLPLRVVTCLSAYRRLKGLYDASVLVATLDQGTAGAQGRMDARGVSFENALRLTDFYLQGFGWKTDSH